MSWLTTLPVVLVQALATMMPRLQAEEHLAAIEAAQLGAGLVEAKDAQRRIRELEREALGSGHRAARKSASPDQLAAMGIGLRMVDTTGAELSNG